MIATGARPITPPISGLKEAMEKQTVITSRELLAINEAPKSLVVIGGGVIGVEFATMFMQLGSKVTIIEKMPGILPSIDDDIRDAYEKILKKDGINDLTNAEVKGFENNKVIYHYQGKDESVEAEKVLLSIGMRPNVEGFENLGIKIERQGIVTNEYLQTTIPNIYAIGDVNGKYMLAHVASAEGIVAAEHMFSERKPKMRYDRVPSAIYGSPEIASVGITEKEAKEKNINYKVSTFPLAGNGRALSENEKDGFIKLIVENGSLEVLGAHILAYNASELIAEIGVTMELEGTAFELGATIHAHPTLSEIIMEAAFGAIDKPIHI
jgi:dihydrolipoamide dehydrogenase